MQSPSISRVPNRGAAGTGDQGLSRVRKLGFWKIRREPAGRRHVAHQNLRRPAPIERFDSQQGSSDPERILRFSRQPRKQFMNLVSQLLPLTACILLSLRAHDTGVAVDRRQSRVMHLGVFPVMLVTWLSLLFAQAFCRRPDLLRFIEFTLLL